ncbi:serine protease [uncultured Roseovarius sp.]|uniref:trypsin-like serine peptidase n=1 Tax=uncultured Roseovarius sp. TaxID=293344 RepID=UPI00261B0EF7|nr:serine protease [uncultured Roseovarius sp.]
MSRLLPSSLLTPLLQTEEKRALVDQVLETIYNGWPFQHRLETLTVAAAIVGKSTAKMLSDTLVADNVDQQFLSILRARGTDLIPQNGFIPPIFEDVENDSVDPEGLAIFNNTARTGRCRIVVGDEVMGSGGLISRRLVITAAHVIRDALTPTRRFKNKPPRLMIRGADGRDYPAWHVFVSPPHENELMKKAAPDDAYESHADVAILRIYKPIGRPHKFGHFKLPNAPSRVRGTQRLWLVHFPEGKDEGYSIGRYVRDTERTMYLGHDAETNGGSSGGPAFDGKFNYIGHHQGKIGKKGRIVPFERYMQNADFAKEIESDNLPDYLWSIDESIDSHMIIGREPFFDALTAMITGSAKALRGIWVRRMDTSQEAGLSFSYKILNAFLQAHESPSTVHRISTDLLSDDLLGDISRQVLGVDAAPITGAADTSLAASDKDRAKTLASALQRRAMNPPKMPDEGTADTTRDGKKPEPTHWFYFDNPPSGLSRNAQVQMEHLVAEMLTRPNLRVVLAGFETFSLVDRQFETIMESNKHGPPGLFVEYIGEFTRDDLHQTIGAMIDDLGIGWTDAVIAHVMTFILTGFKSVAGAYPSGIASEVAEKLRTHVRLMEGIK